MGIVGTVKTGGIFPHHVIHFVLIYLYCANINFSFFPDRIRTKLVIGAIGIIYILVKCTRKANQFFLTRHLLVLLPVFLWMAISIVVNKSDDAWFLQYSIQQVAFLCGGLMIMNICGIKDYRTLVLYLFLYVLLQNLIAFAGLSFSGVQDIIRSIEKESIFETHDNQLTYRAFSLGDHVFFGGGVWSGLGMLFLCYLYKEHQLSGLLFLFLFFVTLFTGIFVARTALVGLVSIVILLVPLKKNIRKIVLLAIVFFTLFNYWGWVENFLYKRGFDVGNAFEIFNNIQSGEGAVTNSSESTAMMWKTIPDNIKTWIIGDAKYVDNLNGGYYMHTDVGYLRVLWYGGVIGLFLYLSQIFSYCKKIYIQSGKDGSIKLLMLFYLIITLLCMWKGLADTSCILYLFLGVYFSKINEQKYAIENSNDN